MKSPFPWFGGKSRAAADIWQRLGDVRNYIEPFAGSLAVLLLRPTSPKIETINDLDCYVANFWRALASEPETVAKHAAWPVNEADLHSRHVWLLGRNEFRHRMKSDPDYYDAKIAGWWVWGQAIWIGGGWCNSKLYYESDQQIPHRPPQSRPHLSAAGHGVHRLSNNNIYEYFDSLSNRLKRVRVTCGNWDRILGDAVTTGLGITGVLLDPPYSHNERESNLYAIDQDVTAHVLDWSLKNGGNPMLRIALCGYDIEYESLQSHGWTSHIWSAPSGYAGINTQNARERIWFSPYCLPDARMSLFEIK